MPMHTIQPGTKILFNYHSMKEPHKH